jgi:hypothetical protein
LRTRYEAVEADFQRYYGMDVGELYTGRMKPLRAARLAHQLPPGAAIFRSDDLDSQVYSLEAQLLRVLINMQLENKRDHIPTADRALEQGLQKEQHQQRRDTAAQALLQMQRQAEAVSESPDSD